MPYAWEILSRQYENKCDKKACLPVPRASNGGAAASSAISIGRNKEAYEHVQPVSRAKYQNTRASSCIEAEGNTETAAAKSEKKKSRLVDDGYHPPSCGSIMHAMHVR